MTFTSQALEEWDKLFLLSDMPEESMGGNYIKSKSFLQSKLEEAYKRGQISGINLASDRAVEIIKEMGAK